MIVCRYLVPLQTLSRRTSGAGDPLKSRLPLETYSTDANEILMQLIQSFFCLKAALIESFRVFS